MQLPRQPSRATSLSALQIPATVMPRTGLLPWADPSTRSRTPAPPANLGAAQGALLRQVLAQAVMPAPPNIAALAEALRQRFAGQARALLFYGSCRRVGSEASRIVDLYVLVDDYRAAHGNGWEALANRVLAPNVYYLEVSAGAHAVRAKYAVVSMEQFERGTSRWFHPYLWARFAQPCSVLYAADAATHRRVTQAIAQAVRTFASRVLPRLPAQFDAEDLWSRGLALTFATELRSERPERVRALYVECAGPFGTLTHALATDLGWTPQPEAAQTIPEGNETTWSGPAFSQSSRYRNPSTPSQIRASRRAWAARRVQGKVLSILRLLKASLTFEGGMSYIAWKIERHSGVKVEITPFMRRFPPLGAISAAWRTWRLGGFR